MLVDKLGAGYRSSKNRFPLSRKANKKQIIFDFNLMMASQNLLLHSPGGRLSIESSLMFVRPVATEESKKKKKKLRQTHAQKELCFIHGKVTINLFY